MKNLKTILSTVLCTAVFTLAPLSSALAEPNEFACGIEIYISPNTSPIYTQNLMEDVRSVLEAKGYEVIPSDQKDRRGMQLDIHASLFEGYSTHEQSKGITVVNKRKTTITYKTHAYLRNIHALKGNLDITMAHIKKYFHQSTQKCIAGIFNEFTATASVSFRPRDYSSSIRDSYGCSLFTGCDTDTIFELKDIGDEKHLSRTIAPFIQNLKRGLPSCEKMKTLVDQSL